MPSRNCPRCWTLDEPRGTAALCRIFRCVVRRRVMRLQFLVGCSVSVLNIMIHALITLVAIGIARRAGLQRTSRPRLHLVTVMVVTALVPMTAHTAEIIAWSLPY